MQYAIGQRWRYKDEYSDFVCEIAQTTPHLKSVVIQCTGGIYFVGYWSTDWRPLESDHTTGWQYLKGQDKPNGS